MDYKKTASEILSSIGGSENIASAAHCATRLRLVIADNSRISKDVLENIDGVKGVFESAGQLQIIIGTGTVNKVYDEFIKEAGISAASKDDVKKAAASKAPWYKRAIKTLGDIFVPIIPAIVASGLLMGLLEGFTNLFPSLAESDTYTIFHLFSNAAFTFLPVLIAISAARVFGGNMFLGAVIGMIMIHPDLMNAWNVAGADSIPTASVWFGAYDINLVGYQGHVIPVVIAVWFMSFIEKRLHKIVPEMIDLFVTPLVTVLITGYLTLTVFGPVFSLLENGIFSAVKMLIAVPGGIGAALCGAIYAPTVVAGIHHMYNALEAGLLSADGVNIWMPIATAANVAQGAAALAFSLKTRDRKQKSIALPASLSAFLGITEPAIFGVNLRFFKPFIAGCIGGAAGGLISGLLHVGATAYGITGVFGILITTSNLVQYLLVMAVAFAVAFIVTMIIYRDKPKDSSAAVPAAGSAAPAAENEILSPLAGTAIALSDVPDPTFAQGVLGQGAAVEPSDGKVYAPADAEVSTLFDTKHAIGLTLKNGAELLIHIGINTVDLNGEGFTAHVSDGDSVKQGDLLISFDKDFITKKGFKTVTPVIVTNPEDFDAVSMTASGKISALAPLLKLGV
ncbi:MAG TPA: PTS glucose transporter subunit IIA [Candidatus Ornithomonoglobus merdipullorum]|uniref:PTS glucose transporter subunit IIA n=1 Tax=Candidatus Ornithomonoglobus merdipullorum TaxID=2840895 RepID=A0A9D1MCA3_9FIRM|nr:PTS glucose transporter subunit IIA [Candidatus Ornithomonoglobus merdipullorum]